jgi:class 3 adenylate cyclase/tetratricopeptide (TPR) repeat protein
LRCAQCGTDNAPGAKFCVECGTGLSAICPACGHANAPGAKFCAECGAAQQTSRAEPSLTVERAAPIAERRLVTVLFADLVGFTAASEERDPEDTRELLSRYFDTARETVERYGGTVEKFIGDAVMAVWGTPITHEDDAERAVRAALELVEAVTALDAELQLRAGVLTGEAAVTIGATGEGMVAGDLVNTASRLQSAAPPGSVLVGESTYQATREAIAYESAGEQDLKGKSLPVEAWRALRIVAGRKGSGRAEGIEPPFVGRDAELRQLKELLDTVTREQKAWLVSVTGQPGIGKSRLAWEFEKYVDGLVQGVFWHQGRSPAYGEGITFWALGEMVRQRARIAENDDPATTAARLAEMLAEYVPDATERGWIEPRLEALLGLGDAPSGERSELFAAWRRLFELMSERDTTVLVFEDLQWADAGLVDFIESLLEWSRTRPILVITLARPEILDRHATWGAGQWNATSMRLEPLPEAAMTQLLAGIAPGLPERAVRRILERAEGVPLYAVETVRMLLDSGRLRREGDQLELVGDLVELEVPTSLQALVAARLDGLDPADRSLLQDAAVLGQTFSLPAISALAGFAEAELEPRLVGLVRREVLARVTDPRSPERGQFSFVQAIIREVAEETLARRDRRARHLAAARYYEQIGDDELAGVLANHYLEAYRASPPGPEAEAVGTQARLALRGAAERAAALHSHEQAVALLSQALSIAADAEERAALLEQAATSYQSAGHLDDAEANLREAVELHRQRDDLHAAGLATARLGSIYLAKGIPERAIDELRNGLEAMPDPDDPAVPQLLSELARGYMFVQQVDDALETVERALLAAGRIHDVATVLEALTTKGPLLEFAGRRDEGVTILTGVIRMAETHRLPLTQLRAIYNLAGRTWGDSPAAAHETTLEGIELARRLGMRDWLGMLVDQATSSGFHIGQWDWVLDRLEEFSESASVDLGRTGIVERSAVILAYRGDFAEAERLMAQAAAASEGVTDAQAHMSHRWSEHDIALAAGDYRRAYDAAMDLPEIFRLTAPAAYTAAGIAAVLAGDRGRYEDALSGLQATAAEKGLERWGRANLEAFIALHGAMTGGSADLARVRRALAQHRELESVYQEGVLRLATISALGAGHPHNQDLADEARQIFTRLGARALLDRLDELLPRKPVAAPN